MKNIKYYQIEVEIWSEEDLKPFVKQVHIKRDHLRDSRAAALFQFETLYKRIESGRLKEFFEKEGYEVRNGSSLELRLYLSTEEEEGQKKILLHKIFFPAQATIDFEHALLVDEQKWIDQVIKKGIVPHPKPVEEEFFLKLKVLSMKGGDKVLTKEIDFNYSDKLDAFFYFFQNRDKKQEPRMTTRDNQIELYIIKRGFENDQENFIGQDGNYFFGLGYLLFQEAEMKSTFETGMTGYFPKYKLPMTYSGELDRKFYGWWE